MNCETFREQIIDLILPGAESGRAAALAAHAESCPACAQYRAEMESALDAVRPSHRINASDRFKEGVMNRIMEAEREARRPKRLLGWRPALAAAVALIAVCAGLLSVMTRGGGGSAVAATLNKAIEAVRAVHYIQIKSEPATPGHVDRIWAEFEKGKLLRMRMNFPNSEDGTKVVLWEGDQARVWIKEKNIVAVVREPDILAKMKMTADEFDPHFLLERLQKAAAAGEVKIDVSGSMSKVEPIVLVVSYPKDPKRRDQYTIDIPTSQVKQIEKFELRDGKFVSLGKMIFMDYDNPKVAEALELKPPAGATVIDQVKNAVGLARGGLGEAEIAKKVAQEFFEALVAGDYDKAGMIYEGVPGADLKKMLGGMKFLRIVSIGEARKHSNPLTGGWEVPCQVEIETGGKKIVQEFKPGVRPVYNQPDRWDIFGGI